MKRVVSGLALVPILVFGLSRDLRGPAGDVRGLTAGAARPRP